MEPDTLRGGRRFTLALAIIGVVFLLSLFSIRPPSPLPASAPAAQFSAERARAVQFNLTGDGIPHPIGSQQNEVVRQRIIGLFKQLGYDPQVQTAFDCDEFGTCGTVKNVLARLDGTEPGTAVLVAAHYDSVPAGPGASDDGSGAATVLEIARALKTMPAPRHSVILMIDDGEEAGLLGAHAFVDFDPWAKEVRAAVNVDVRGSSGPSLMFETGSANAWAVRLFAQHALRPATNSILYTVYKTMPNDTDFTVFKGAGYQGLNFGYVGGVTHYHTPLDNMQNASPASLQHQGDNALPVVVALANAPQLDDPPPTEAVYSDILGRWIARWPANRTWPAAIIILLLIAGQIVWLIHRKRLTPGQLVWGVIAWMASIVATGIVALIIVRALKLLGALPVDWVAHSLPVRAAMWSLALTVVIIHAVSFAGRAKFWGLWAGVWSAMAVLTLACAVVIPGFSFIFIVSTAVAAISALPFTLREEKGRPGGLIPVILPLIATGITGFGVALMFYDGLGVPSLPIVAVIVAVLLAPLLPLGADLTNSTLMPRLSIPGLPIIATIALCFFAAVAPAYSAKSPEHLNFQYWLDGDTGHAQWLAIPGSGSLPASTRKSAKFQLDGQPFPWSRTRTFAERAPRLSLAPPIFTIQQSSVENGKHVYRMMLLSERGAPEAAVMFPPGSGIDSVSMDGVPIASETEPRAGRPALSAYLNGWTSYGCDTIPSNGVTLSFTLPVGKPITVFVIDKSFGLPPDGKSLLAARPKTATASQDGDVTLVSRRVELIP
ncbi:MAG TPA: M28 family peptidase [Candidatus Acidoferrales bacterium]|nr:M28 family peptidase [Candidatus Acidoferrales bacterium]